MNLKEKFLNRDKFTYKFADNPFDANGVLEAGWKEPTYEEFFERMTEKPVLLDQSAVVPMTALQHDLDMMDGDFDFESQRDRTTGVSLPLTENEVDPELTRKQLIAQPLQAKTVITDNFLEENIESDDFMTHWMNYLSDKMGPALERWGVFSNPLSSASAKSGFKMTPGIIAQLETVAANDDNEAKGIADVVYSDNVGEGIMNSIQTYVEQNGNIDKARLVLPPAVHSKFLLEISKNKDTPLGDSVFQDGNMTSILGIEIVADPILKDVRNGYGSMKFNDGVYDPNGTAVDKLTYGFLGKPENIVFGMMREFDVKHQYDLDVLGYKVALLAKVDAKVLWDQDTLAIPFTRNNS